MNIYKVILNNSVELTGLIIAYLPQTQCEFLFFRYKTNEELSHMQKFAKHPDIKLENYFACYTRKNKKKDKFGALSRIVILNLVDLISPLVSA